MGKNEEARMRRREWGLDRGRAGEGQVKGRRRGGREIVVERDIGRHRNRKIVKNRQLKACQPLLH